MAKWVVIQVGDEIREVCENDFAVLKPSGHGKPEVVYIKLGEGRYSIYVPIFDTALPRSPVFLKMEGINTPVNVNVISEAILNKLLELEEAKKREIERIEKERARIGSFDVFVKEKGKFAELIVDKDISYVMDGKLYVGCYGEHYAPDVIENKNLAVRVHVTKVLKYEDGSEEIIEEYVADGCRSVSTYESDDGYGIRRSIDVYEKPETRQILTKVEYTMIPISELTAKLYNEREEIEKKTYEEQRKILLEELRRKGFKITRNGNLFVIEFNGKTVSEAILEPEEGLLYKGKYSLLADLIW